MPLNAAQDVLSMLQSVDDCSRSRDRAAWIRLLALAPLELLEQWAQSRRMPSFTWLRRPEIGLVMVEGRIGGEGGRFNLGEMTVTRCTLRIAGGASGIGYVRGRSARHAELAAIGDALMQSNSENEGLESELLAPLRARQEQAAAQARGKARATRVEFFTVARGEA